MNRMEGSNSPKVAAFGNPLLDYVMPVSMEEEEDLIREYNLDRHEALELNTVSVGLWDRMKDWHRNVTVSPGGCSLNTCRVLQWLNPSSPNICVFFGSVGKDEISQSLRKFLLKDGVLTQLCEIDNYPTGHCIALANGQERTFAANIAAANVYTLEHLSQREFILNRVQIIYVEGFFLSHSPEVAIRLSKTSRSKKKVFALNLCGGYVCQERSYVKTVLGILPDINLLFGNSTEFRAFTTTALNYGLNLGDLSILEEEDVDEGENEHDSAVNRNSRLVIITDGPRPITCFDLKRRRKWTVTVAKVPIEEIKDTVGAGDSFIAGYLSSVIAGKSSWDCIRNGTYASQEIIKQSGVTLPDHLPN